MVKRLLDALDSVLLGKHESVEMLVMALLADGHVLIEDVPGTGKTTLAKALAVAIGADFARIQFTPDLLPADVTGGAVYRANTGDFEIRKGPVFTQVLLADEINRASPRTQSALLEAMEERQVSLEGETHRLPELFFVLATENPVEFHGVFPLPEAQMDRFMVRLSIGYPTFETEMQILHGHREGTPLSRLEPVTNVQEVLAARDVVRKVHIDEALERYVEIAKEIPIMTQRMKERELTSAEADHILMEAGRSGLVGWSTLGDVSEEFLHPTFADNGTFTSWGLYSAFTHIIKKLNPNRQLELVYDFQKMVPLAEVVA